MQDMQIRDTIVIVKKPVRSINNWRYCNEFGAQLYLFALEECVIKTLVSWYLPQNTTSERMPHGKARGMGHKVMGVSSLRKKTVVFSIKKMLAAGLSHRCPQGMNSSTRSTGIFHKWDYITGTASNDHHSDTSHKVISQEWSALSLEIHHMAIARLLKNGMYQPTHDSYL